MSFCKTRAALSVLALSLSTLMMPAAHADSLCARDDGTPRTRIPSLLINFQAADLEAAHGDMLQFAKTRMASLEKFETDALESIKFVPSDKEWLTRAADVAKVQRSQYQACNSEATCLRTRAEHDALLATLQYLAGSGCYENVAVSLEDYLMANDVGLTVTGKDGTRYFHLNSDKAHVEAWALMGSPSQMRDIDAVWDLRKPVEADKGGNRVHAGVLTDGNNTVAKADAGNHRGTAGVLVDGPAGK